MLLRAFHFLLLSFLLSAAALADKTPEHYSLPPDKLQRAIEYAHAGYWLHFGSEIYAVLILAVIVASGLAAKFRDWATAGSKRRFVQALVFVPLLLLTNDLLYLPASIYGQHLELKFDQSIQSWPSWLWDWTKSEMIRWSAQSRWRSFYTQSFDAARAAGGYTSGSPPSPSSSR